jgi:hypothetical protein
MWTTINKIQLEIKITSSTKCFSEICEGYKRERERERRIPLLHIHTQKLHEVFVHEYEDPILYQPF